MKNFQSDNISNYQIIKIQPTIILMRNKQSRKIYRYMESTHEIQNCVLNSQNVVCPIITETGYLYQAGFMTLAKQLQSINKSMDKCSFDEQEIVNTVQPILNIVCQVHKLGQSHGAITPDNIILDQMGNLKIYYPGIRQNNSYFYPNSDIKKQDDFKAVAFIILELLGFNLNKQVDHIKILRILAKTQKYSEKFIFAIYCMVYNKAKFIGLMLSYFLNNQQKEIDENQKIYQEIKQIYDIQILQKNKKDQIYKRIAQKVQFTPPLIKHGDYTPRKTLQMTKKYVKGDDVENKKIFQQCKKKKPVEQTLKKVSNGKKQCQYNLNLQSPSYKKVLRDIRQTKQRQDIFKGIVTVKRMRTVSKKKLG